MQSFGRLRQDIENCVRELVMVGVARVAAIVGSPSYCAAHPSDPALAALPKGKFLETPRYQCRRRVGTVQLPRDDRRRERCRLFEWIRTAAKSTSRCSLRTDGLRQSRRLHDSS